MSSTPDVFMPNDVEEQNVFIRESGIPDFLQTGLGQHGDLLYWSAVHATSYGTSDLLLCAGYWGGEFATRPLARNCVENPYDDVMPPLTLDHLLLLQRLAVGPEEFRLEYGHRFVYTGITSPGKKLLFPAGTQLVIEVVTFGHVAFWGGSKSVLRSEIVAPAFNELPSY